MQSFSSAAKSELCRAASLEACCMRAECFGILLFCNSFQVDSIRIVTESEEFAASVTRLFRKTFHLAFDEISHSERSAKYVFRITDRQKIAAVMDAFGFDPRETLSLQINFPVVEMDCCKAAFLRGAFLAGGSVTDPGKAYHLELVTTHHGVARQCCTLIQEIMDVAPMLTQRAGSSVIYFKQNEKIVDFLTCIGASVSAMNMMEARLEKELNNQVNRRCNCDDANISKVVAASAEQLRAIRMLREQGRFEALPGKLKQAAILRENNPEAALSELAELLEPPISKPAMSHRLKRLLELSQEEKT